MCRSVLKKPPRVEVVRHYFPAIEEAKTEMLDERSRIRVNRLGGAR